MLRKEDALREVADILIRSIQKEYVGSWKNVVYTLPRCDEFDLFPMFEFFNEYRAMNMKSRGEGTFTRVGKMVSRDGTGK